LHHVAPLLREYTQRYPHVTVHIAAVNSYLADCKVIEKQTQASSFHMRWLEGFKVNLSISI